MNSMPPRMRRGIINMTFYQPKYVSSPIGFDSLWSEDFALYKVFVIIIFMRVEFALELDLLLFNVFYLITIW